MTIKEIADAEKVPKWKVQKVRESLGVGVPVEKIARQITVSVRRVERIIFRLIRLGNIIEIEAKIDRRYWRKEDEIPYKGQDTSLIYRASDLKGEEKEIYENTKSKTPKRIC